jgi:hypothetical protein
LLSTATARRVHNRAHPAAVRWERRTAGRYPRPGHPSGMRGASSPGEPRSSPAPLYPLRLPERALAPFGAVRVGIDLVDAPPG